MQENSDTKDKNTTTLVIKLDGFNRTLAKINEFRRFKNRTSAIGALQKLLNINKSLAEVIYSCPEKNIELVDMELYLKV